MIDIAVGELATLGFRRNLEFRPGGRVSLGFLGRVGMTRQTQDLEYNVLSFLVRGRGEASVVVYKPRHNRTIFLLQANLSASGSCCPASQGKGTTELKVELPAEG